MKTKQIPWSGLFLLIPYALIGGILTYAIIIAGERPVPSPVVILAVGFDISAVMVAASMFIPKFRP